MNFVAYLSRRCGGSLAAIATQLADHELVTAAQGRPWAPRPAAPPSLRPRPCGVPANHRPRRRRRRRSAGGDDRDRAKPRPLRRTLVVRYVGVPHRHQRQPRRAPPAQAPRRTQPRPRTTSTGASRPLPTRQWRRMDRRSAITSRSPRHCARCPTTIACRSCCAMSPTSTTRRDRRRFSTFPAGTVKSRIARGRAALAGCAVGYRLGTNRPTRNVQVEHHERRPTAHKRRAGERLPRRRARGGTSARPLAERPGCHGHGRFVHPCRTELSTPSRSTTRSGRPP